jgi:hypothetical protein
MSPINRLDIPAGAVAQVKIIDTTTRISKIKTSYLMQPPVQGFEYIPTLPSWSFLVESPAGKKVLFDLGTPKDWENMAPETSDRLKTGALNQWIIDVPKNAAEVLEDNHVPAADISSIIWR